MKELILLDKHELIEKLWAENPRLKKILANSESLREARDNVFQHLNKMERDMFNIHSKNPLRNLNIIEKNNVKSCLATFKNFIRTENEIFTGFSALDLLWRLSRNTATDIDEVSKGFFSEIITCMKGITGKADFYAQCYEKLKRRDSKKASKPRSEKLDQYSQVLSGFTGRYRSGTENSVIKKRRVTKKIIMEYFNATEEEWKDYRWHLEKIIHTKEVLEKIIKLEDDEKEGLQSAWDNRIPFQITPYYLSLFSTSGRQDYDRALRAQVIPSIHYCKTMAANRKAGKDTDFMDEKSTSPLHCITRRYPQILILKPYDSCPQICVYCQRNWELKDINEAAITKRRVNKALKWIKENDNITEVLVTGGDPLTLNNDYINWILGRLSEIKHIERIRIGTRVLVTLPARIDSGLIKILKKYHRWGQREICVMTHFEHPAEITPDALKAIKKIKNTGINIYNQQVFTYYNSRKFETAYLRRMLKISGVDPYYSFNTKGKEETADFRVPIARIEQERQEEARLLPGVVRTDEPVFNVPKLGKSHLRAWQDHEVIMVMPDGKRVYRFYPWVSRLVLSNTYLYTDVSIYDYLKRLDTDGEDVENYKSIWYYF